MQKNNAIVLVGFRSAAIKAALRLNLPVIVWSSKVIPKKYQQKIVTAIINDFPASLAEFPSSVLSQLKNQTITTVLATTEQSVVPAALLSQLLKLSANNIDTAEICRDKLLMKLRAKQNKIPMSDYMLIETHTSAEVLIEKLHLPIVLKQRSSSGSRGMHIAYTKEELQKNLMPGYLAERFITGTELSMESYVKMGKVLFTNCTQYYKQRAINIVPDFLPVELHQKLLEFNQQIITAMGISTGITHTEIFITSAGLLFGEIAIRPPGGYLMDLLKLSYGFDAWEALLKLNNGAAVQLPNQHHYYSASWVIHPGAGTVKNIENLDKLAALPSVKKIKLSIKRGDVLKERTGAGHEYGHILFCTQRREDLIRDIESAQELLRIELDR